MVSPRCGKRRNEGNRDGRLEVCKTEKRGIKQEKCIPRASNIGIAESLVSLIQDVSRFMLVLGRFMSR